MRKKIIILLLLMFCSYIKVEAYGPYNYEVSEIELNGSVVNILGWGKMNGGTCHKTSSGCIDRYAPNRTWTDYYQYGSGLGNSKNTTSTSDSCKSISDGVDYRYTFKLHIDRFTLDTDQFIETIKTITMNRDNPSKPNINLTYSTCPKNSDGNCSSSYISSCYRDVGFQFSFDLEELNADGTKLFKTGVYRLKLEVISGFDSNKKTSFYIGAYANIIPNNLKDHIDEASLQTQLYLEANRPNGWVGPGYSYEKHWDKMDTDRNYDIYEISLVNNQSWYKVRHNNEEDGDLKWIPSSWARPADPNKFLKIMVTEEPLEDVGDCSLYNDYATEETFSFDACNSSTVSIDKTSASSNCTNGGNEYYSWSCGEKIYHNHGLSYSGELKIHKSVNYNLSLTAYKACTYDFNHDFWNTKYNYYVTERAKTTNSVSRLAQIEVNINKLISYVNIYKGLISEEYEFNPSATIKLAGVGSSTAFNFTPDNNDAYNEQIIENAIKTNCITLENGTEVCDYRFGINDETKALKFTGNYTLTNGFILSTSGDQSLTVNVNSVGEDGLWSLVGTCPLSIKDKEMVYRSVDNNNPFDFRETQEEICNNRSNWCNDTYNFKEIIKEEVWVEEAPKYEFSLTTEDIEKIKSNNSSVGTAAYTGEECVRLTNGKYYCSFLRNPDYFTESKIAGE